MFKLVAKECQNLLQHCHQHLSVLHNYFYDPNKIIFRSVSSWIFRYFSKIVFFFVYVLWNNVKKNDSDYTSVKLIFFFESSYFSFSPSQFHCPNQRHGNGIYNVGTCWCVFTFLALFRSHRKNLIVRRVVKLDFFCSLCHCYNVSRRGR